MKIAYTTTFDATNVRNWSGTPYHMSQAFSQSGASMHYIGNLHQQTQPFFKIKQIFKKYIAGQRESPRFNVHAAKHYSQQTAHLLKQIQADIVLSPLINPIAYLDCSQPIVLWTDALYAALIGFYAPFSMHSASSIAQGNAITQAALSRTRLAIFSSEWAANSAIELYGMDKEKVYVVPFGANLTDAPSITEINQIVQKRKMQPIKLLFLAKSWERKGGDIVVAVAKALHEAGHAVELTIIGYKPAQQTSFPSYIKCLGYISKHTPEGRMRLHELLQETHFLFVPSRAEAYGIVFCEANAFAIPCLSTYIGGIGTIIKNNINGYTFPLDAPIATYCDYITRIISNHSEYRTLALSAYHEYRTRLNWQTAVNEVKRLIASL